jgi:alkylation response protein AidB-like acyl-CoA dehydrogenase
MLSAQHIWCQGFSEPGAGSDLAALQTRAARDGDAYVVDGQKVWISYADKADRCFLLCRTDPEVPKHKGLSVLVVDMHGPGVECRPIREIAGDASFNEVFFTDVRVPAADRIGDESSGWQVAMSTLTHERVGTVTFGIQLRQRLEALLVRPETWPSDPVKRRLLAQEVAALWTQVEIIRLTALRAVTKVLRGEAPWPEVPIGKMLWSTLSQDIAEAAMHALGPDGLRWRDDPGAPEGGRWAHEEVFSRMTTIGAGTTEVQKNILAERALGLPRG